jgi:hypothetical protein
VTRALFCFIASEQNEEGQTIATGVISRSELRPGSWNDETIWSGLWTLSVDNGSSRDLISSPHHRLTASHRKV